MATADGAYMPGAQRSHQPPLGHAEQLSQLAPLIARNDPAEQTWQSAMLVAPALLVVALMGQDAHESAPSWLCHLPMGQSAHVAFAPLTEPAGPYRPAAQGMPPGHDVRLAPADAACVPGGQRSQLAPLKYRPAGQALQSLALVAPALLV